MSHDNYLTGIVAILGENRTPIGTGFVAHAPDFQGCLIVTCYHVLALAGKKPGESLTVRFHSGGEQRTAQIMPEWCRPSEDFDLAILQVEGDHPPGVQSLLLGSSAGTSLHAFDTYGYASANRDNGMHGPGTVIGLVTFGGCRALQLQSDIVTSGFSGAPVWDRLRRRVVGVIRAITVPDEFSRLGCTALATSADVVVEICSLLRVSDICPYLGLSSFEEQDARFFKGRRRVVERLLARLRKGMRLLVVLGPSGSGKSSAVHAGLIPDLRAGKILDSDRWGVLKARPDDDPFAELTVSGSATDRGRLARFADSWLANNAEHTRLVLVLDQFEDLFISKSEAECKILLDELGDLLGRSGSNVTVILVLRADFYGRLLDASPRPLIEQLDEAVANVPWELSEEEVRAIIEEPAREAGIAVEAGLTELIVLEMRQLLGPSEGAPELNASRRLGATAVLPLLEQCLTQLWDKRDEGELRQSAYLEVGGLGASIGEWAQSAFNTLAPPDRSLAWRVLTSLVYPGDPEKDIPTGRQRLLLSFIRAKVGEGKSVERIIQYFAQPHVRLLVTNAARQTGDTTVELIHDAVFDRWPRFRQWLQTVSNNGFLAWRRRLEPLVERCVAIHPDEPARRGSPHFGGQELVEAEGWLARAEEDLFPSERQFIRTAVARRRRRWRIAVAGAFAALLCLFAFISVITIQWRNTKLVLAASFEEQGRQHLLQGRAHQALVYLSAAHTQGSKSTSLLFLLAAARRKACPNVLTFEIVNDGFPEELVTISPNGLLLATPANNHFHIWDVRTGKRRFDLIGNLSRDESWRALAFSPRSDRLVGAGFFGSVQVWDMIRGQTLSTLQDAPPQAFGYRPVIIATSFTSDGERIRTFRDDGVMREWDIHSGAMRNEVTVFSLVGPKSKSKLEGVKPALQFRPLGAALSRDGKFLVTRGADQVQVWETGAGNAICTLQLHPGWGVDSVSFTEDNTRLVTACNGEVQFWSIRNGQQLDTLQESTSKIRDVALAPGNRNILTIGVDGIVRVWDLNLSKPRSIFTLDGYNGEVTRAVFTSDGKRIVTIGADDIVRVWDITKEYGVELKQRLGIVRAAWFSSDGKRIVIASGSNTTCTRIWEPDSQNVPVILRNNKSEVVATWFGPNDRLVGACKDGSVLEWNLRTGAPHPNSFVVPKEHEGSYRAGVTTACFSRDGGQLITVRGGDTAWKFDLSSGATVTSVRLQGREGALACGVIAPNGERVIVGEEDGRAWVWSLHANSTLIPIKGHTKQVVAASFSADDGRVATASDDGTARIWDLRTGQLLVILEGHSDRVAAVSFSPDGQQIVTGSSDGTARIWDANTGSLLTILEGHTGPVCVTTFSQDGRQLATASANEAYVWNVSIETMTPTTMASWVNEFIPFRLIQGRLVRR